MKKICKYDIDKHNPKFRSDINKIFFYIVKIWNLKIQK